MTTRTHRSSLDLQLGRAGGYCKMAATLCRPLNLKLSTSSRYPPVCVSPCHGWPLSAVGQRCCESVTNESTGRCSGSPPLLVVLLPVSTVTAATIVGQWQDRASSGKWVSER